MCFARRLNLLVIDDSPTILAIVTESLQSRFGDVLELTSFTDPREADRFLEEACCDILLVDVEMPGMTGLQVLQAAKARNCWTQGIIMTAHSTCDRLSEAMDCGASDYLLKPIKEDQLVEVVHECVKRATRWQAALRGTLRTAHA